MAQEALELLWPPGSCFFWVSQKSGLPGWHLTCPSDVISDGVTEGFCVQTQITAKAGLACLVTLVSLGTCCAEGGLEEGLHSSYAVAKHILEKRESKHSGQSAPPQALVKKLFPK